MGFYSDPFACFKIKYFDKTTIKILSRIAIEEPRVAPESGTLSEHWVLRSLTRSLSRYITRNKQLLQNGPPMILSETVRMPTLSIIATTSPHHFRCLVPYRRSGRIRSRNEGSL